jgi:hypothetical protein
MVSPRLDNGDVRDYHPAYAQLFGRGQKIGQWIFPRRGDPFHPILDDKVCDIIAGKEGELIAFFLDCIREMQGYDVPLKLVNSSKIGLTIHYYMDGHFTSPGWYTHRKFLSMVNSLGSLPKLEQAYWNACVDGKITVQRFLREIDTVATVPPFNDEEILAGLGPVVLGPHLGDFPDVGSGMVVYLPETNEVSACHGSADLLEEIPSPEWDHPRVIAPRLGGYNDRLNPVVATSRWSIRRFLKTLILFPDLPENFPLFERRDKWLRNLILNSFTVEECSEFLRLDEEAFCRLNPHGSGPLG